MEHDEEVQIAGTVSDYLVQKLSDEERGEEFTVEYLRADFLAAAANALSTLRHKAGLTQAEVADQLHTKQSAIARLEADDDGAMSLRRYVDFALACGVIPHHFTFAPVDDARNFTIGQPETPLTFENQLNWGNATFRLTLDPDSTVLHGTFVVSSSATTLQEAGPKLSAVETQARSVRTRESAAA
jgi:transcriptional regulator with XRE-family HTH domain